MGSDAVRRNLCSHRPCWRLGIRRACDKLARLQSCDRSDRTCRAHGLYFRMRQPEFRHSPAFARIAARTDDYDQRTHGFVAARTEARFSRYWLWRYRARPSAHRRRAERAHPGLPGRGDRHARRQDPGRHLHRAPHWLPTASASSAPSPCTARTWRRWRFCARPRCGGRSFTTSATCRARRRACARSASSRHEVRGVTSGEAKEPTRRHKGHKVTRREASIRRWIGAFLLGAIGLQWRHGDFAVV